MKEKSIAERISALQDAKASHEKKLAKLEGQKEQLMVQLEKDFGLTSLEDAEAKLASLEKSLKQREQRVERLLDELEDAVHG